MSAPAATAVSVEAIVADVRERGDVALAFWSARFDATTWEAPPRAVPEGDVPEAALVAAADAVRRFHAAQRPADLEVEVAPGVTLTRRWVPLRVVGLYVPTRLISSLVMTAVPAQVAGVERVVVCTPPSGAGAVAAAARVIGVDEVYAVGGAQAVAAMAYGTATIPAVDKIVGPGGGAVNEAKLLVSRDVAIDLPAGPSEVVVVADDDVDAELIDQEVAAQLEHGPDSRAHVVRVGDPEAALARVESLAPEHVALVGARAEALAGRIRNAGAVFVGRYSPVPVGDYATGANHVLPTGGRARSTGGLGLEAFLKPVTVQRVTREGLDRLAPTVRALATFEGLAHHAAAVDR
ncbi:MAG TPA: histidinol dehydrogenase [Acidimicrobiales bacterium]|nr:histidinol dehydrogenase [Acidimicrobiales bacterium]